MKNFRAYMQPAGSAHQYEMEIRHNEQRYVIHREGQLVAAWQASVGSMLTAQQLFDLARNAVSSGAASAPDQAG